MPGTVLFNSPGLTVTEGEIPVENENAKFVVPGVGSVWGEFIVRNHYEHSKHIYMGGITSTGGFQGNSAAFYCLAAPTMLWIADWSTCMDGEQPEIPDPESVGTNWVLMDGHFQLAEMQAGVDGVTAHYRISGTYFYGSKSPSQDMIEDVVYPLPPYLTDSFPFGRTIQPGKLKTGIIYKTDDLRRPRPR